MKRKIFTVLFILLEFAVFPDSTRVVGTTACLDEKPSPPEIDYLEIKIDSGLRINISNSSITLVLDDSIKQQFTGYIASGLEMIDTIESENITIEYSNEIGMIEDRNRKITISFSTEGSVQSAKLYITIEQDGKSSINSINKEHCEELLSLLEQADTMISDFQRQIDLFNSGSGK